MQMKYNYSINNVFIFQFEMKFHEIQCARIFHRFIITIFEIKAYGLLVFGVFKCMEWNKKTELKRELVHSCIFLASSKLVIIKK